MRFKRMTEREHIKSLTNAIPDQPGVYQFFDREGKIIYIGKAKNLKKRVASYFNKQRYASNKLKILVSRITDIKYIVVNSESDALLLENNLIKKYQPRYNILLKDDKTFPWICIKNEPFPRIFSTRSVIDDGSTYYGPYTSAYAVKVLLSLIRQLYQLRTCKLNLSEDHIRNRKYKLCLEYHIGNCKGPCEGLQSSDDYDKSVAQIKKIIRGKLNEVVSFLKAEMENRATRFQFEEAARLKEKIEILSRYQSKSTIVNPSIDDVDVFSIISDEKEAYVNYLKVIHGAVVQAHTMEIKKKLDEEDRELLALAIAEMRTRLESSSKEMILPMDLKNYFPEKQITVPRKGEKKKLLDLSFRNARSNRNEKRKKDLTRKHANTGERILQQLQDDLRLQQKPDHIECFDNSNIQGSEPVAACVVFKNGKPAKSEYRHYHIRGVKGIDDFASMKEVVFRRYNRLLKEGDTLPRLIIIDGGKGQLSAALESLERLNLRKKIALIGIAKKLEEIYFPDDPVPLYIDKSSESLKLIQNIRNEAHRFGINFHRQQRSGKMMQSALESVPGIGAKSIEKLFIRFKSLDGMAEASMKEIAEEVGNSRARMVKAYLREMGA